MRQWSAVVAGIASVFAAVLAGTGCTGDTHSGAGTAGQRESVYDWRVFGVADANFDRLGDLYWASNSANLLAVWLMNGAHVRTPGRPIPAPPSSGWTAASVGDVNRDGLNDVVWANADRGSMLVYLMKGTELLAAGSEIPGPPGNGWRLENVGDTNGDGMADVIWHNVTTNRFAVWLMNGTHLLAPGPELPGPPGEGWAVANLADANNDDMADIIWANAKMNAMTIWLMNGTHVLALGPVLSGPSGDGWTVVTTSDLNGDGNGDVLWTNADHSTMTTYLTNGARLLAAGPVIHGPPGDGWSIAYAGDTNGDSLADVVWQKAGTNLFTVWLMNGAHVLAPGPELTGPAEPGGTGP